MNLKKNNLTLFEFINYILYLTLDLRGTLSR